MGTPSTAAEVSNSRRLHITPFNSTLLDRLIPPSLQPQATNISYHTLETFPERGFGYVDLPVMEAEKLKKKLNGATLKGVKVRIEDARPEKKRKAEENEGWESEKERRRTRKEKRKREEGVLPGHELDQGRHVKRGWTDDNYDKKHKEKDEKKDNGAEDKKLRFKTVVPPNVAPMERKAKTKGKKDKKESKGKKMVVVQEFAKAQKPDAANAVSKHRKAEVVSDGSDDEAQHVPTPDTPIQNTVDATEPATTPAPSSADEPTEAAKEVHPLEALFKRPAPKPDSVSGRASQQLSATKPVPGLIDTSFSFFNSGTSVDDDADTELGAAAAGGTYPQTPRTKQAFDSRRIRSAAPSPDTPAMGRNSSLPFASGEQDEEEDEEAVDDTDEVAASAKRPASAVNGEKEESEFRRWFYDTRGEHNRDWKKRRREARKAMRQMENRRLRRRVV